MFVHKCHCSVFKTLILRSPSPLNSCWSLLCISTYRQLLKRIAQICYTLHDGCHKPFLFRLNTFTHCSRSHTISQNHIHQSLPCQHSHDDSPTPTTVDFASVATAASSSATEVAAADSTVAAATVAYVHVCCLQCYLRIKLLKLLCYCGGPGLWGRFGGGPYTHTHTNANGWILFLSELRIVHCVSWSCRWLCIWMKRMHTQLQLFTWFFGWFIVGWLVAGRDRTNSQLLS